MQKKLPGVVNRYMVYKKAKILVKYFPKFADSLQFAINVEIQEKTMDADQGDEYLDHLGIK